MLSTSLVHEIDMLLSTGELSRRKIALRLGVSRGTVNAIANGRRGLHGKDERKRRPLRLPTPTPSRCPKCGYRVYMPCLICDARQLRDSRCQKRTANPRLSEPPAEPGADGEYDVEHL